MQTYPEQFPPDHRTDPKRQAEARIFDAIQASSRPGFAYYEWKRDHRSPEVDFALWLLGVGRFSLQVKGGQRSLRNGKWYLATQTGRQETASPSRKAWRAAMSLREEIVETLDDDNAFIIAVLLFPDMEPDPAIAAMAEREHTHHIWRSDNLFERLEESRPQRLFTSRPTPRISGGRWLRSPAIRFCTVVRTRTRTMGKGNCPCRDIRISRWSPSWESRRAA